jgi:pimeloyl-ACP methyl ester carboxylesterase
MDEAAAALAIRRLEDAAARHDVPVEGTTVAWRRFGRGRPIVLVHGGHGSWLHWVRNVDALAASFEVWLPDLPGYGDSGAPAAPTLDALLEATRASLDALLGPGTPVGLAGFSFGGLVAAHLARRRGATERLVLFGPAGHGTARRPTAALRPWREAQAAGDRAAVAETMRHNLAAHMLAGEPDALALAVHTRACLGTRFRSKPISLAGGLGDVLAALRCPVRLVWGEHDPTAVPAVLAPALAARCADGRAEIVAGAGHWVPYERAAHANALLHDAFGAASAGGRGD